MEALRDVDFNFIMLIAYVTFDRHCHNTCLGHTIRYS